MHTFFGLAHNIQRAILFIDFADAKCLNSKLNHNVTQRPNPMLCNSDSVGYLPL